MSLVLIASGSGFAALADQPVVPRAQVQQLSDAAGLLAEAEARLAGVDALREATRAEARAAGYADGLAHGRAFAATEAAAALRTLNDGSADERRALRASTGRLALEIVRRIAGDLGPEATTAALAERAARQLLPDQPLTVRVRPEAAGAVAARLWPLGASIEVQGDVALTEHACVLETSQGRTVASLDVQLAALEAAFATELADDRAVA